MIQINPTTQELNTLIKDYNLQQDSICTSLYVYKDLVLSCNRDLSGVVHTFVNKALFKKIENNLN